MYLIMAVLFMIKSDTSRMVALMENNENDKFDRFFSKFCLFLGLMYLVLSIFS